LFTLHYLVSYNDALNLFVCFLSVVTSDEMPFKCRRRCDKTFVSLNEHSSLAQNPDYDKPKPYKCNQCDKAYGSMNSLSHHRSFHKLDGNATKCNICDKVLSTLNCLKHHMMIHTGEKPFKCQHCNEAFRSASNRNCHEERHTSLGQFKCTKCNILFIRSTSLSKHMKEQHVASHAGMYQIILSYCHNHSGLDQIIF